MVCSVCGMQTASGAAGSVGAGPGAGGPGARFCSGCGVAFVGYGAGYAPGHLAGYVSGRLVRPRHGRVLAGVCAGFAQRYGWDPIVVRLMLVLTLLFGVGTPLLAYLLAWIVMPNAAFALPVRTGPGGPTAPMGPAGPVASAGPAAS